jgi:hypothetical protein
MAPKNVLIAAVVGAAVLACNGASAADQYRGDELLGLDLSKAVLSPKPLGPPAGFTPVPAAASTDRSSADTQAEPLPEPKAKSNSAVREPRIAHLRAARPRGPVHTRLARRHANPLDAQAFDTRIQVWPCKSGGICGWR